MPQPVTTTHCSSYWPPWMWTRTVKWDVAPPAWAKQIEQGRVLVRFCPPYRIDILLEPARLSLRTSNDSGGFSTDFGRVWLLTPRTLRSYCLRMTKSEYLTEYDGIVKTVQMYIDGSKQGKSELMRPAFHPDASFFGYAGEQLAVGTQFLFDWIDKNGPAPKIEPRVVSVDILDSIAVVRLEVAGWSGNLAGSGVRMSDLFTLLKTPSGWKIIQKAFHWHA